MELTHEDELTIKQYIRLANPRYDGPVIVSLERLKEIYMQRSRMIAIAAWKKARYESKRAA